MKIENLPRAVVISGDITTCQQKLDWLKEIRNFKKSHFGASDDIVWRISKYTQHSDTSANNFYFNYDELDALISCEEKQIEILEEELKAL